jgi:hypothetical protein
MNLILMAHTMQAKWGYDIGGNGWANNELQYYTNGLNASSK